MTLSKSLGLPSLSFLGWGEEAEQEDLSSVPQARIEYDTEPAGAHHAMLSHPLRREERECGGKERKRVD